MIFVFDYISVGEMLIDFTGGVHQDFVNPVYEQNPGGSCANAAVCAAKLGMKTAFIGKVGNDNFGKVCKHTLDENKVDTSFMQLSSKYKTTLAFVHLDENGERSFSFYRDSGADTMLTKEEIPTDILKDCKALHFCTVAMTKEPSRSAVKYAVQTAKDGGAIISFDPNIRFNLWDSKESVKAMVEEMLPIADVVKISDDEAVFISSIQDPIEAGKQLAKQYNIPLLFVTLGAEGCFGICGNVSARIEGKKVSVADTTGAGDSFAASAIFKLINIQADYTSLNETDLREIMNFANTTGALVTTKKGAIPAMPTLAQVKQELDCSNLEVR